METTTQSDPSIKMLRLYKYPGGSGSYVMGTLKNVEGKPKYPDYNGKVIQFISGKFTTDDPIIIEELDAEVKSGNVNIIIDPREPEIDSRAVDPLFRLREQIRSEERAKMAAAINPTRDMGESSPGRLKPSSTTDIAPTAIGGPGTAALLASLNKNK